MYGIKTPGNPTSWHPGTIHINVYGIGRVNDSYMSKYTGRCHYIIGGVDINSGTKSV